MHEKSHAIVVESGRWFLGGGVGSFAEGEWGIDAEAWEEGLERV